MQVAAKKGKKIKAKYFSQDSNSGSAFQGRTLNYLCYKIIPQFRLLSCLPPELLTPEKLNSPRTSTELEKYCQ